MKQEGGLLSAEDLAEYRSPVGPPERRRFGDLEVFTCGAWCQGPVLLQTLALLEGTDLASLGQNSPDYIHHLAEALKLAFADREAYFGDPAISRRTARDFDLFGIRHRAQETIRSDRAFPEMPPPGDLGRAGARFRASIGDPNPEPDTSYVCVADRFGNLFSATPSDGSYGSPVVPGTGLIPSNRGSQSRPDPRHPAGVAPGKRPRLTPNPALAIKGDGEQFLPFGTPGGDVQTQAMLQVLLNLFVFGHDVQSAIESPRFATYSFPSSFAPFEYYPGRLAVEGRIPEAGHRRTGATRPRDPALARLELDCRCGLRNPCRPSPWRPRGRRRSSPRGLCDRVVARAGAAYPGLASNVAATVFAISRNWCRTFWSVMA